VNTVKVEGAHNSHKVFLYTLTTCSWCKLTKKFLKDNDVSYEYLDLDTASKQDQVEAVTDLKKRNAPVAFPTIIIDDTKLMTGFHEQELAEAIGLDDSQ
jgi:glutaredoxin-like protein NrdH